jgi:hypothetical protein
MLKVLLTAVDMVPARYAHRCCAVDSSGSLAAHVDGAEPRFFLLRHTSDVVSRGNKQAGNKQWSAERRMCNASTIRVVASRA